MNSVFHKLITDIIEDLRSISVYPLTNMFYNKFYFVPRFPKARLTSHFPGTFLHIIV